MEVRVATARAGRAAQERAPVRQRPVVRLKREISDRRRRTLVVLSLVVPLALLFLPSPASVVRAGWRLASSGLLGHDILATVRRVGIGFGLVVLVSVPLGVAMGTLPSVRAIFEPMIGLVRYMPAPAFIPLLIIWLGLGEGSKIALLFIGTLFFNTLMTADAAALVPKQ